MALWPFRKRRKRSTADGKKVAPVLPDLGLERRASLPPNSSKRRNTVFRRNTSRRRGVQDRETSYASSTGPVPDFPLPPSQPDMPAAAGRQFQPQKQQHVGGFASYFQEQNPSAVTTSSTSSHLPHKQSSIVRKLSQRRADHPPVAYNSRMSRENSKHKRTRSAAGDRPLSLISTGPRVSVQSMYSDASSGRAYKIRNIDVLTPRPTLRYEEGSSPTSSRYRPTALPGLTPSRTNSKRSTKSRATVNPDSRYKGIAISEEQFLSNNRVNGLADELDASAIRQIMERDLRRKERKRQEDQEKMHRRLDTRALEQGIRKKQVDVEPENTAHEQEDYPMLDAEIGESSNPAPNQHIGFAVSDTYPGRPTSTMGTQTPLSWLDINPSTEDVNKGVRQFPRPDVVTPVSMNSQEDRPTNDSLIHHENLPEHMPNGDVGIAISSPPEQAAQSSVSQAKTSIWSSLIRRATTKTKKENEKDQEKDQLSRAVQVGESTLVSDSEGYGAGKNQETPKTLGMEVDALRHREGQTPGRHIPKEITFAMTALETGHLQEQEYEDEMRDSLPVQPLVTFHHSDSPSSSMSSLGQHNLSPRPQSSLSKRTLTPQLFEDPNADSPTIPPRRTPSQQSKEHSRPVSIQRYTPSPSVHRHSSGAASPENAPRSIMSTSLASIDSEGSWLSGKVNNPRRSIQQISPLRTSASSLQKRYLENEDQTSMLSHEDYFTGVKRTPREKSSSDVEVGGARLDLSDASESEDEGSVVSETEHNTWKEGMEKKVVVHERPMHARTLSRQGVLDDFGENIEGERRPSNASTARAGKESPGLTGDETDFATPMETPMERPAYDRTTTMGSDYPMDFQTPLEHPAARNPD